MDQILAYFRAYPQVSICGTDLDLGITCNSINRISQKCGIHPFKFTRVEALQPREYGRRFRSCDSFFFEFKRIQHYFSEIIWTDEALCSIERMLQSMKQIFLVNSKDKMEILIFVDINFLKIFGKPKVSCQGNFWKYVQSMYYLLEYLGIMT